MHFFNNSLKCILMEGILNELQVTITLNSNQKYIFLNINCVIQCFWCLEPLNHRAKFDFLLL